MTPCRCIGGRGRPPPGGSSRVLRTSSWLRSVPGWRSRRPTSGARARRWPAKSRTTAPARAPESSQLDGYWWPPIGCESVWPSTTTGCLRSSRTTPAILSTSLRAYGFSVASPESKKTLSVSSWMTRPRRRIVTLTLPCRPAPSESLSIRRLSARKSCSSWAAFLAFSASLLVVVSLIDSIGRIAGSGGSTVAWSVALAWLPEAIIDLPPLRTAPENASWSDAAAPRTSTCSPTRWRRAP